MVACLTPDASSPALASCPQPWQGLLPRAGELVLRVHAPAGEAQTVHIRSNKCTIGSAAGCTLRLRSPSVLPLHCWILRGAAGTVVRRLHSAVMLNGRALGESALRPGDRLQVGSLELEVIACNEPAKPEPTFFQPPPETLNELAQLRCQLSAQEEKTKRIEAEARQGFDSSIMAAERADQLRDALAAAHEQLEEACRDLANAQNSQQTQMQELAASQQQRQVLESNQQVLTEQLDQARREAHAASGDRDALTAELQALQATVAELRAVLADQEATLQAQQAQFQAERTNLETERQNFAGERSNFENERTQLQRRLNQRDAELEALRSTTMAQTGAMTVAISELSETQRSLKEELSERCTALTAQLSERQAKLDDQQAQLAVKQHEIESLQQALAGQQAAAARLVELQQAYDQKCGECAAHEQELGSLKANTIVFGQLDSREQALFERETALAQHEEGLALREAQLAEQQGHLAEREQDLTERAAKLATDRGELEARQQELITGANTLTCQQQQLASRDSELAGRESELAAQAGELSAQAAAIASERSQLTALREQLNDERNELLLQRQELSELQERLTQREFQVAEHEAQRAAFIVPSCEATADTFALEQQVAELEGQLAAAAGRLIELTQLQEQCLEQRSSLASREQELAMRASELADREQRLIELACQLEQRVAAESASSGPAAQAAAIPQELRQISEPPAHPSEPASGPPDGASFEPPAGGIANWTPEGLAAHVNGCQANEAVTSHSVPAEPAAEAAPASAAGVLSENIHDSGEVDAVLSRLVRAGLWRTDESLDAASQSSPPPTDAGEASAPPTLSDDGHSNLEPLRETGVLTDLPSLPDFASRAAMLSAGSAAEDGDEESIESYMERLMKRVRGDSTDLRSEPQPQVGVRNSSPSVMTPAPVVVESNDAAQPAEYSPRRTAPELSENLTAMRELANTAARSAIDRHVRVSTVRKAYGKLVGACATVTASLVLGYWASHVQSFPAGVAAGIGGASGAYWTFAAIRRLMTLRRVNREQQKAEQAKAAQSQAIPSHLGGN